MKGDIRSLDYNSYVELGGNECWLLNCNWFNMALKLRVTLLALNPKALNPRTLNPKALNPKTLNPKALNPKALKP